MTDQMWQLIATVGSTGWCVYCLVSVAIVLMRDFGRERPEWLKSLRAELKPFALPLLLAAYLPDIARHPGFWNIFWLGIGLQEKLAARVADVGGRLQVVPVGGQS